MDRLPHRVTIAAAAALALTLAWPAAAQTSTASPQPVLPGATASAAASPVVDSIVGPPVLEVRKQVALPRERHKPLPRHLARLHRRGRALPLERPALAGVFLVEPIEETVAPPRPIVPMPAYFVDGIASAFLTPPPPVVCERRRRDRTLPDPRLYREVPVACSYDLD